ncbi:hypothetical protein NDU88_004912 [Pleurodeles waltl]|uniref:Uncharacterized protein n=1 Tax=Pleurodeles waltl TaxID=8319 RepID=A0AAV7W6B7_PLEWA|nr:hypothetical protein NDU88_004912 [Pleurodeles waltl]
MLRARRADQLVRHCLTERLLLKRALAQRKLVGQIPPGDRASLSAVMTRLGRRTTASAQFSQHFGSRENSCSSMHTQYPLQLNTAGGGTVLNTSAPHFPTV